MANKHFGKNDGYMMLLLVARVRVFGIVMSCAKFFYVSSQLFHGWGLNGIS